jgi:hypothetical protein
VGEIVRPTLANRDHEVEAPGPQAECDGGRVDDHVVALADLTDQVGERDRHAGLTLDLDVQLGEPGPLGAHAANDGPAQANARSRIGVGRHAGSMMPRPCTRSNAW